MGVSGHGRAPAGAPRPVPAPAGGLQAVADLLQVDYEMHKMTRDPLNLALRRYAGMTLTNLTFGDVANKVRGAAGGWAGSALSRSEPSTSPQLRNSPQRWRQLSPVRRRVD